MFPQSKLEKMLQDAFPQAKVEVRDTVGDNDHYEAVVICPTFVGKSRVDRHRMVLGALGNIVGNEVHALALRTLTPDEVKK